MKAYGSAGRGLAALLGENAAGFSPSVITRLVSMSQLEYGAWRTIARERHRRDALASPFLYLDRPGLQRPPLGRAAAKAQHQAASTSAQRVAGEPAKAEVRSQDAGSRAGPAR